jgi:hypothetical protein
MPALVRALPALRSAFCFSAASVVTTAAEAFFSSALTSWKQEYQ